MPSEFLTAGRFFWRIIESSERGHALLAAGIVQIAENDGVSLLECV